MSLPKEPRQKMINVMYLVLTALLALNVSAEILNAFITVNNSLQNSNVSIDHKNETLAKSFDELMKDPTSKERATIWKPKADKVMQLSEDVSKYLEGLKEELKKTSKQKVGHDGKPTFSPDDLGAATHLFIDEPKGKQNGKELLRKLTEYKANLLAVDPSFAQQFPELPLDLKIPESHSSVGKDDWAFTYFHMTPTIAALTILSKFQNDIKNSETQIVDYCHQQVGKVKIIFDQFQALASQNSEYLMPGQELTIKGGVGAFSSAAKPLVTIDGASVPLNPTSGMAEYKTTVGGPGSYSKKVSIRYKTPDGKDGVKDVEIKYTVGSPTGASVSADATKVFYIGLNNPISVSGGTKGDEATQVSIDNGSLTKTGPGKYDVSGVSGTKATVTVTVDGKSTPFEFRVKPVPLPVAKVGISKGGRIVANEFKAQQGLRADLENFVFEGVKYSIASYKIFATGKGFSENPGIADNPGAVFGSEARRIIDKATGGTSIIFDEIKAIGPDGKSNTIPSIVFNLTN